MFYPEKLRKIRKAKKVTQGDIAKALGKSKVIVSFWEQGRRNPGNSDIYMIAKYLDINVQEISDLQNMRTVSKSSASEVIDMNIRELDNLIGDYGKLPENTLYKIQDLKTTLINYSNLNTRLKKALTRYNALIDNLFTIIYSKDTQLRYTYVNDTFLAMVSVEHSKERILGTHSYIYFGEDDIREIIQLEKKAILSKEKIVDAHVTIPGSHGRKIGLLNITPIIENNSVKEIICSLRDVTEKYRNEKLRKELEIAINNLDQLVWIAHPRAHFSNGELDYTFINCNNRQLWAELLQDIISLQKIEFVYPEDREIFISRTNDLQNHQNFEYRIMFDNQVQWIREVVYKKDNIYYGTISNITKLKLDETARNILYSTLNMTVEGLWIKQKKPVEKFFYLNKAIEKIWGLNLNDFYQDPTLWLKRMHPDDITKESDSYHKSEYPIKRTFRIIHPVTGIRIIEDKRNCYINSDYTNFTN